LRIKSRAQKYTLVFNFEKTDQNRNLARGYLSGGLWIGFLATYPVGGRANQVVGSNEGVGDELGLGKAKEKK
jgi:hypothetical protein